MAITDAASLVRAFQAEQAQKAEAAAVSPQTLTVQAKAQALIDAWKTHLSAEADAGNLMRNFSWQNGVGDTFLAVDGGPFKIRNIDKLVGPLTLVPITQTPQTWVTSGSHLPRLEWEGQTRQALTDAVTPLYTQMNIRLVADGFQTHGLVYDSKFNFSIVVAMPRKTT